jgi:hypothetical protein
MGRRGTNGQSQGGERDGLVALGSAATALGSAATAAAVVRCSRVFYRYIDLTNQQVFLRRQGRITSETWHNWCEGIAHHFGRPAFRDAWEQIRDKATTRVA